MTGPTDTDVTQPAPRAGEPSEAREPGSVDKRRRLALVTGGLALGLVIMVVVIGANRAQSGDPSPLPSQSSTVPSALRLTWAPPPLINPVDISISPSDRDLRLLPDVDYRLTLPSTAVTLHGGLTISGGHNVVLIGGEISVPSKAEEPDPTMRRGLYLKDQTGVIHIEGVKISGADLSEGINLSEPEGATVQLENIEVDTVHGMRSENHADVLQTWAGPDQLFIDGLVGTTTYQGLFLLPNQFTPKSPTKFDLRRIVLTATPEAGYLLWTADDASWLSTSDVALVDPYASSLGRITHPASVWSTGVELFDNPPPSLLPVGTPGTNYVTPGYQQAGS